MTRTITLSFILILLFSCEKKISQKEFEQNVFDKIFINIVDSTYKDKRLYTFYPLPGMKEDNLEFQKQRKALEKDTLDLVIAVDNQRKIDFQKFKNKKFIFKKLSEIQGEDIEFKKWTKKYPKFAGAMSFSKITFDKNHENGKLTVSYSCGGKCGVGYEVYIKKEKRNWIIIRVKQTWVS